MRRLLVPFDGSDNALRGLAHAISLAQRNAPISIHVVTVHELPDFYGAIEVYVSRERMAELQRAHSEGILQVARRMLQETGVPHTEEILIGPTAETIARQADALGCEGIVMGTRGMTTIGSFLMGSVAMKVVHAANVPVTLVK
jgi:nucleotide-binding universal stress UspA family protein